MSVARASGNRGLADILFSRIIRSRGRCEFLDCASVGPYDTAHIIGRTYSATRCVESNAWCLCRTHHVEVDNWPDKKLLLVRETIGYFAYDENRSAALAGHPFSAALFWASEAKRLKARCEALGIDSRRRVPA